MRNYLIRNSLKLLVLLFYFYLNINIGWSQDPLKDIKVSGSSVFFIFNSYNKYNDGIELDSWTRLRLRYKYTGQNGWELFVRAGSNEIQYDGGGSNNIDISSLEIIPSIASSDDPNPSLYSPVALSNSDVLIASGDGGDPNLITTEIVITYKLGVPPNPEVMMNRPEGYYYVDLIFTLIEK